MAGAYAISFYQFLFLQTVFSLENWGESCHEDCQCHITSMSQTVMSNCLKNHEHEKIKAAFCVLQNETELLGMFQKIPNDTEALTLLQGSIAGNIFITYDVMAHLTNLIGIDFQGSSFKKKKFKISSALFKEFRNLQYVSMQNVKWGAQKDVLSNVSSLLCLQIIKSDIGDIVNPIFEGLTQLKELYMIQNGIKSIGFDVFKDTNNLQKISLSNNKIAEIFSSSLEGLHALEILDMTRNHLQSISSITFPFLPKLHWLELQGNPINTIFPNAFWGLNSIRRISIGHKKQTIFITKLALNGLTSLKLLHIPNIDTDMIAENVFTGLKSLLHLELNGRVTALGKNAFLGSHAQLDKIVIHNCKLEFIHDKAFMGLSKLSSLDLSFNFLEQLSKDLFHPLVSLEELILSQNRLKTLHEFIFQPFTTLQSLRLDSNPWNCTCTMSSWSEELTTRTRQFIPVACSFGQLGSCKKYESRLAFDPSVVPRCEYPLEWQGESVFNVINNRLFCEIILLRD